MVARKHRDRRVRTGSTWPAAVLGCLSHPQQSPLSCKLRHVSPPQWPCSRLRPLEALPLPTWHLFSGRPLAAILRTSRISHCADTATLTGVLRQSRWSPVSTTTDRRGARGFREMCCGGSEGCGQSPPPLRGARVTQDIPMSLGTRTTGSKVEKRETGAGLTEADRLASLGSQHPTT